MSDDDFLFVGLDTASKKPAVPPQDAPEVDPSEAEMDTAARLMQSLKGKQESAPVDGPRLVNADIAASELPADATELPIGAVMAADGQPFTDWDAAKAKSHLMSQQAGESFLVCAIAPSKYVVVPQSGSAENDDQAVDDAPSSTSYRDIPIDQLTLADFPDNHPVHKCGLSRYRRYMKKNFKFKPAYRSMWPLLVVSLFGGFLYMFPVAAISQLPQDVINNILTAVSPEQFTMGVSYFGAALGVFALVKVLVQRHIHRYMLLPGYAKYEYGLLKKETTKIAYRNISNYEVNQTVLGRLLNYGDMELASPGTNDSEIKMKSVFSPILVEAVLEGKIEESRLAHRGSSF